VTFLPHLFTTHEFWTGGLIVGGLGSVTTYISTRASDRRKAKQEDKVLDRKEEREDKLREQDALREAAMEFTQVSTDILTTSIDINGIFNTVRDMFYTKAGIDDPNVEPKLDHSQKVMDAQMRIAVPVNKLKMFAPTNVLAAATRATTAIMTTVQQTTEPFARLVAHKAAADELNNFISVFQRRDRARPVHQRATARAGGLLHGDAEEAGGRLRGRVQGRHEGGWLQDHTLGHSRRQVGPARARAHP
jgi:hypothetical protein